MTHTPSIEADVPEDLNDIAEALERALASETQPVSRFLADDIERAISSMRRAADRRSRSNPAEELAKTLEPFGFVGSMIPEERPDDEIVEASIADRLDDETVKRIGASSPHSRLMVSIDHLRVKHFRAAAKASGFPNPSERMAAKQAALTTYRNGAKE